RDEGGVLAVRPDADVRAVALGEDVQARPEVQVDAEPPQLPRFEESLLEGKGLFAGGSDREVVRKDRHALTQHDDPSALVIGRDEKPPAERALQPCQHVEQLRRRAEVPPVEDEARRARVAEQSDVGVTERWTGEADHQALADEVLDVHWAILSCRSAVPCLSGLFPWMTCHASDCPGGDRNAVRTPNELNLLDVIHFHGY